MPLVSDIQVGRAVASMRQRSERQTALEKLVASFVDLGILPQIDTPNNQILFGRRGTGKTHVLKVYQARCLSQGFAALYVDARTFGSSSQFLDPELPKGQRCVALFRDLMAVIHDGLLEYAVMSASNAPGEVLELMNQLADAVTEQPFRAEPGEVTVRLPPNPMSLRKNASIMA